MSSAGEELGGVWGLCLPQENPALFKGDLAFPIQVMLLLGSFPEPRLWSLLQRLHNIVKLRHGRGTRERVRSVGEGRKPGVAVPISKCSRLNSSEAVS